MISTELKKEVVGKLAVISCAYVPERSCEEESPSACVLGKHTDWYGTCKESIDEQVHSPAEVRFCKV
jgi:hypothetical protein